MKHALTLILVATAVAVGPTGAAAQGRNPFPIPPGRVAKPQPGGSLTLPSTASPRAIIAQYLQQQGTDEATAQSIAEVSPSAAARNGIRHLRFEQRVAGMPVYGRYVKAAFNSRGELVHLVENLARVPARVGRARITDAQAVAAAIQHLYPTLSAAPAGFWHRAPSASRVAIPAADGTMSAGFLVETWTQQSNQLHYTLVGGDGAIQGVESRTSTDSYRVFRDNPGTTPQTI